jgi:hypothetical protein
MRGLMDLDSPIQRGLIPLSRTATPSRSRRRQSAHTSPTFGLPPQFGKLMSAGYGVANGRGRGQMNRRAHGPVENLTSWATVTRDCGPSTTSSNCSTGKPSDSNRSHTTRPRASNSSRRSRQEPRSFTQSDDSVAALAGGWPISRDKIQAVAHPWGICSTKWKRIQSAWSYLCRPRSRARPWRCTLP